MVIREPVYVDKARIALTKNIIPALVKRSKIKKCALPLLEDMNLRRLLTTVKNATGSELHLLFSAKIHKLDVPYHSIVSERGTWQCGVSGFLQEHLSKLEIDDPFLVPNSVAVVHFCMIAIQVTAIRSALML